MPVVDSKKEGTGDDQVWNRMLTVWIDDSQIQDDLVLARELDGCTTGILCDHIPGDENLSGSLGSSGISLG